MKQNSQVTIRKFMFEDIMYKIEWINNPENNTYLHYDLPLEYEKTANWFKKNKDRIDRYDAVIEVDNVPVGLIGLLSIDRKNRKAEYYISMGDTSYKGKGVAYQASRLLLEYAFCELNLEKVYLYTETDNKPAQKLFKKVGFKIEGTLKNDLFSRGRYVDRYAYGYTRADFYNSVFVTPIQYIDIWNNNKIYVKRDDFVPYSFGGNKARKAKLFFNEIDKDNYDCIVTYGSSHSNHCRIVANLAAKRKISCYIIAPLEVSEQTFNSQFMDMFGAEIVVVPVENVSDAINAKINELRCSGKTPYFIPGGGHGNIGTHAYVNCYNEICYYEEKELMKFDYIFFASGTGTTHAGLVCGQLLNNDDRRIVGISIARKNPRGRDVVIASIHEYLVEKNIEIDEESIQKNTIFIDDYTASGYGKEDCAVDDVIKNTMIQYGIPMDSTYTGKAFYGMQQWIEKENIMDKNILFIHTGGTPLFFDDMRRF